MFTVGQVVRFKITGTKVMILKVNENKPILRGEEATNVYTVRMPDYKRAMDINEFELVADDA